MTRKKHVAIAVHKPLEAVPHRHHLSGTVFPPTAPVQVLVYSHDARWYLQADATVKGRHWRLSAYFGFPDSVGYFSVVAIVGARVKVPRLDGTAKLPRGTVASMPIIVMRK